MNTIELSNDSNASGEPRNADEAPKSSPPARIYLKQELAKPENLKPEMLVRFRGVLADAERNGVVEGATGSASESDAAQDWQLGTVSERFLYWNKNKKHNVYFY